MAKSTTSSDLLLLVPLDGLAMTTASVLSPVFPMGTVGLSLRSSGLSRYPTSALGRPEVGAVVISGGRQMDTEEARHMGHQLRNLRHGALVVVEYRVLESYIIPALMFGASDSHGTPRPDLLWAVAPILSSTLTPKGQSVTRGSRVVCGADLPAAAAASRLYRHAFAQVATMVGLEYAQGDLLWDVQAALSDPVPGLKRRKTNAAA